MELTQMRKTKASKPSGSNEPASIADLAKALVATAASRCLRQALCRTQMAYGTAGHNDPKEPEAAKLALENVYEKSYLG